MAVKYRIRELDVYVWSERYANAIYPPSSRIEIEIWCTADGDVVKVDAKVKDEKKNVFDIRCRLAIIRAIALFTLYCTITTNKAKVEMVVNKSLISRTQMFLLS